MIKGQGDMVLKKCLKLPKSGQRALLNDLAKNEVEFEKFLDDLLKEQPDINSYLLLKTFINAKKLLPSKEVKDQIKNLLLHYINNLDESDKAEFKNYSNNLLQGRLNIDDSESFENLDELVKDEKFLGAVFKIWDDQRKEEKIHLDEYYELAEFIGSKRVKSNSVIGDIEKILAQYTEIADERLAIDIDEIEFSGSIKSKMDAIIDDINNDRMPFWRYHELLYINYFDPGNEEFNTLTESRTFIAYAIPKLQILHKILNYLSYDSIGTEYLEVGNYSSGRILSTLKLYLENHKDLNSAEREVIKNFPYIKDILDMYKPVNQTQVINHVFNIEHISTHENSVHSSADKSHIEGFKRVLVICKKQNITLGEIKESYTTINGRLSVKFTKTDQWNQFVQSELLKLHQQIKSLLKLNDAELFEKYVRYIDLKEYKDKSLVELSNQAKEKFQKKIKGLRFKASSAERYMDSMINNHRIDGSGYPYNTNEDVLCGINIEEMVAIAYNMSKDKENYREGVNEATAFLMLISGNNSGLYDMKRGYNIDDGQDDPDDNIFPNEHGIDTNRCRGGGVNSLANAVAAFHNLYEVKLITRKTLESEIQEIYQKIIDTNIEEIKKLLADDQGAKLTWSLTGKIQGKVREFLKQEFITKNQENFLNGYINTVSSEVINSVINQALDSVKIPDQLKEKFSLEKISNEAMYEAIANNVLSILHLSENGYESTINYLSNQEGRENLVQEIFDKANHNLMVNATTINPQAIKVLSFLAKSNVPDQFNFKLDKIKNQKLREKGVNLRDIAILNLNDMRILFTSEDVIDYSINNSLLVLFWLYATKVGFTENELKTAYGAKKITPLMYSAATMSPYMTDVVKTIIETAKSDQDLLKHLIMAKDINGCTVLHNAAYDPISKAAIDDSVYKLSDKDKYGHSAPGGVSSKAETINTILEAAKSDQGLLKQVVMAKNNCGYTALHLAFNTRYKEAINAIIEVAKSDQDLLSNLIMVFKNQEEGKTSFRDSILKERENPTEIATGII